MEYHRQISLKISKNSKCILKNTYILFVFSKGMLLTTEQYLAETYHSRTQGDKSELYNLKDLLRATEVLYENYNPLAMKILTNKDNIEFAWATDQNGNQTDYKVLSRVVLKIVIKWADKFRVSKFYFFPQQYGQGRYSYNIGNGHYCDTLEQAYEIYKTLTHD